MTKKTNSLIYHIGSRYLQDFTALKVLKFNVLGKNVNISGTQVVFFFCTDSVEYPSNRISPFTKQILAYLLIYTQLYVSRDCRCALSRSIRFQYGSIETPDPLSLDLMPLELSL